ncbi:MAG: SGNH/GDSL hydrolase family protein [Chloroflexi bacterium]|nr:SGNH/GDSL hydrolase family protein [Chloroflexota bacterium]
MLGPATIAVALSLIAVVGWTATSSASPSAAAGSQARPLPADDARSAATVDRLRPVLEGASRPAATIVETGSSEARPTRPLVDVPEVEAIAVPLLARGSRVVFVGDSFTTGWNGAGIGTRGWPAIVGRARGWTTRNLAVAGTGFVNPGWTGQTIGSRVAAAIRARPDIVFVAGGHNDSRWSAATTSTAAIRVIDRLHAALPDAVLVIVAPIWQNGSPPSRCLILRDRLRQKAAAIGAIFIDPLAEGWFSGPSHRLIGGDGLHPTDAGHRYLAERVLADLAGT